MDYDQSVKSDDGKLQISLVPTAIIYDIAKVREYGVKKYGEKENWKNVEIERYFDALLRHILPCFEDIGKKDEESGFPHLYHAACNLAFILEFMKNKE